MSAAKRGKAARIATASPVEPIGAVASAAAILAASRASEDQSAINMGDPDDAALLALQQAWLALQDAYGRLLSPRSDAAVNRHVRAEGKILKQLAEMQAHTLAGLAFKAEVSKSDAHMSPDLVASIMDDVAAMAAVRTTARI